ncbi:MAG: flagellar basal body rod protein FlgF [Rhodoferax sp.]
MDRLIYTAMSGAAAAANRQSVIANNLANVSTNGFRQQLAAARAVPLRGDGATTRVFALETSAGSSERPGPAIRTDRALDVMAMGNAWFGVQGQDGVEAYTRNGRLEVSPDGTLMTASGAPLLSSDGATITAPAGAALSIGEDGTVTAKLGTQPANAIGRIKLATPTAEDPLRRGDDGLFRTFSGDAVPNDAAARLRPGTLEGSNVNPIEQMVGMIENARQFEAQLRLLQTAESNDRAAGQLLSLQG